MLINMDRRFIYIDGIGVPFPSKGKGVFETSRMVNSARNVKGAVVGQQVGRSVRKQNMEWSVMDCDTWWQINRHFEQSGLFFSCKYFAHDIGEWQTRNFYVSDVKCTPYMIDPQTGIPEFYTDCSFNVIDMGD